MSDYVRIYWLFCRLRRRLLFAYGDLLGGFFGLCPLCGQFLAVYVGLRPIFDFLAAAAVGSCPPTAAFSAAFGLCPVLGSGLWRRLSDFVRFAVAFWRFKSDYVRIY
jgi:hypothetical protein